MSCWTDLMKAVSRIILLHVFAIGSVCSVAADDRTDFFEQRIRPILVNECSSCHGAKKQNGGLRVDSLQGLLTGGDSGPAIVPGNTNESLLLHAINRNEDVATAMPPEKPLSDEQIDAVRRWIADGAFWPESVGQLQSMEDTVAREHWAFQPITNPPVPQIENDDWSQTDIDRFILQKLRASGLSPATQADRRTLIRRAKYGLTGLPPSHEEVNRFIDDGSDKAWDKLISRLLTSEHYGEQWGRHWLDVARYSDTKGYVYAREERFWVHAWSYRDWVVEAFNEDMPYDRFLLLQMAADQVEDRRRKDLAAMGFLTLGRRFLGVTHDIIDDRIDIVSRGTMGLTVSCARCHDHKYDPIPTTDYYSLYGVFNSCIEKMVPLSDPPYGDDEYQQEYDKRRQAMADARHKRCTDTSNRLRDRIRDYLFAQTELNEYPKAGFDQVIAPTDIHPRVVHRWANWLYHAKRRNDPVFRAWHLFKALPDDSFAIDAVSTSEILQEMPSTTSNPLIAEAFRKSPTSFTDVVNVYADVFKRIDDQWKELISSKEHTNPSGLNDPAAEQIRQVLHGPDSPCVVPDEHIANTELLFDSPSVNALWKEQGEFDRWIIQAQSEVPYAVTLVDRAVPSEPRVFRRGDSTNPGDAVPRRFLSLFDNMVDGQFEHGSGRRELANAIIDWNNPLTARVIVNRVWAHHFGQGLVTTPSDFGLRAMPPSHPELLDWLTSWFIENGWSLKKLHRLIMSSAVYQQSSRIEHVYNFTIANEVDPDNRLLWKVNTHRLSFEEFRDSMLAASEELNLSTGGKPFDLFSEHQPRRTLYGLIDRQFLPGTLRNFDFPNPDLHIAERSETTVPQQALFSMNHSLIHDRVRELAANALEAQSPKDRIRLLFHQTLQREPSKEELSDSLQLIEAVSTPANETVIATAKDWSYGYGEVNEQQSAAKSFTAIPHFTGTAWQGGPKWPDSKLGWVSLTAVGGHPGNSRSHACIRRWTAPRDVNISIQSNFVHEPAAGDGVRIFVLHSSENKQLQFRKVHQQKIEMNTESVSVKTGQHIDFVVDIDEVLNSDQFLWHIKITESDSNEDLTVWDSQKDFTPNTVDRLGPWEQLAHLLLCTNEFMFVD